ncbi:MAG: RHS repeat domain-containing protein, partial [Candidatus Geothermincolia bacterium]
ASSVQSQAYTYDASGNMESKTVGDQPDAATTTYAYDASNRLLSDSGGNTYAYDASGNLTGVSGGLRAATTYAYDAEGRMTGATVGQETASYTYDALGRMTKREAGGSSELFALKATGYEPLSITGSAGPTSYLYTPDGSRPLSSVSPEGTASTLGTDIHLDVVFTADSGGNLTSGTLYSPSGEKVASTGTQGALGYQGDYTDGTTGLVSMGLRNYDPSLGRFNTPDPKAPEVADPMSFDTYLYCNDAALGRVDLMGTRSVFDLLYDYVLQPIGHAVVTAVKWVYNEVVQPIVKTIVSVAKEVVKTATQVAQEVYRKAVNAVKVVARTARNIGAKIGRTMVSAAKAVGRGVVTLARKADHAIQKLAKGAGSVFGAMTNLEAIGRGITRMLKSGWEWACRNKVMILTTIAVLVAIAAIVVPPLMVHGFLAVPAILGEGATIASVGTTLTLSSMAISAGTTYIGDQEIVGKWRQGEIGSEEKHIRRGQNAYLGILSMIPVVGPLVFPGQIAVRHDMDVNRIDPEGLMEPSR